MHIKNIEISRYRSITEISIDNFEQVNLFVGKNNCGKTSILESLFIITGISNPRILITLNQLRGIDYFLNDDKDFKLIFNDLDNAKKISIKAKIKDQDRELTISPHFQKNINEITTIDEKFLKNPVFDSLQNDAITGFDYDFTVNKKKYQAAIYRDKIDFHQLTPTNYKEKIIGTFASTITVMTLLPNRLNTLIIQKKIDKIIKILQKIDKKITDITIGTDNQIYFDTGLSELVPISIMGDGIKRLLSIIVTIANQKDGVVFIDEIENGLHHTSLHVLWQTIFDTAKEYNVQVFATTHSYECIKAFEQAFFEKQQNTGGIKLFRVEKQPQKHVAHTFSAEELKDILKDNWEVR